MNLVRVALVTCAALPELDPDDRLLLAPLADLGVRVEAVSWDDPTVDWPSFDLAVLRSTWDYATRRDEFVSWARRVPRLANPAEVVAWNTDKRYLADLAAAGVPTIPTEWISDGSWRLPDEGEWVLKPAVGAGSLDAGRYRGADPQHRRLAEAHVARLVGAGRLVMAQPYLGAVDQHGETAVICLGGQISHAVRKGPMLAGPAQGVDGLYVREEITARPPADDELIVARQALGAAGLGPAEPLYARVDLIRGPGGEPLLIELELTEPSLFLRHQPGAAERLAGAIATLARTTTSM